MTQTYAILERPADPGRAEFFLEAFGALRVPLVDDEVVLFQAPGEKEGKQRYKAAVYSSRDIELRFETSCLLLVCLTAPVGHSFDCSRSVRSVRCLDDCVGRRLGCAPGGWRRRPQGQTGAGHW